MTESEARAIYRRGEEAVVQQFMEFDARLRQLEEKLGLDSSNSSKPPSTDDKLVKKTKRVQPACKKKKKRGAQVGHRGSYLPMSPAVDQTRKLLPDYCSCCSHSLEDVRSFAVERRQVYDLPDIELNVCEFESHSKRCPRCKTRNKPSFPSDVKAPAQYGPNLKSFVSYCNTHHMLPYERISELVEDITSHPISTGVIYNFLSEHNEALGTYEEHVKDRLCYQSVIHSDETGVNKKGRLYWVHNCSSSFLTYYTLHEKRGKEAMDAMGVLPSYSGVVVHDHWSSYVRYDNALHSFCNAHILRELNGEIDRNNRQWAKDMRTFLLFANQEVQKAVKKGQTTLSYAKKKHLNQRYDTITQSALQYFPPPNKNAHKKGKIKQEKGKNLLDRLIKYKAQTLRFMDDFAVPFTNNLAERDLRMIKVKQKISGCFGSYKGGQIFCRIRGYISTCKKNGVNVLQALKEALKGNAFMPDSCTVANSEG